jgi:hypothetical protein
LWRPAAASPEILSAVNVYRGNLVYRAVADAFGLPCEPMHFAKEGKVSPS